MCVFCIIINIIVREKHKKFPFLICYGLILGGLYFRAHFLYLLGIQFYRAFNLFTFEPVFTPYLVSLSESLYFRTRFLDLQIVIAIYNYLLNS